MILKKTNNLALDIQKTLNNEYWLNIMLQNKNSETYFVIAGFDYKDSEDCYELNSIGERLNDVHFDWHDFGALVLWGYNVLNSDKSLKEIYNENKEVK